eukprot:c17334_g1_i3 orf=599-1660(-)
MGQKKAPKGKPKSQAHSKPKDGKEFNAQLGALGLRIVHITADGNCLFRAVADQLEGNEEEHLKYRKMVVDYIQAHREEFEPFLEDDVPFDDYCKSMRETSTWAGNMELQVISLVTHTNICIHRLLSPRWNIQNFRSTEARCIHLSYHNGEHYNSIRRKDDNGGGPAKCILLETPGLEEKNCKDRVRQRQSSKNMAQKKTQLLCAEEESLEETGGDLIGDDAESHLQSECSKNGEVEERQSGDFVQELEEGHEEAPSMQIASSKNGEDTPSNRSLQQVQKVARNKACPCGSRKKFKACCGTVKPPNRPQEVASVTEGLSNKARKQKARNSKGTAKAELETPIIKDPLDMGFLCI